MNWRSRDYTSDLSDPTNQFTPNSFQQEILTAIADIYIPTLNAFRTSRSIRHGGYWTSKIH